MLIIFGSAGIYAKRGAFAATATFLLTFVAALAAFNYYELAEFGMVSLIKSLAPYAGGFALMATFAIIFIGLQYLVMHFVGESIDLGPITNGVAGAVFGGMTGVLLAGILALGWLLMPAAAYYPNDDRDGSKAVMGVDEVVLTTVRFIANDRIPGSAPFDPMHSFMRTYSYKYAQGVPEARIPTDLEPKTKVQGLQEHNAEIERERRDQQ